MASEINIKLTHEVREIQKRISDFILDLFEEKDYGTIAMIVGLSLSLGKIKEIYIAFAGEEYREMVDKTIASSQLVAKTGGGMITEDGTLLPYGGPSDLDDN
jgi:hypothetical protein